MSFEFSNETPIYLQLLAVFRDQILRGELVRGDKLPSVREIALEYGVNPNTVQKAFSEMDRMELTQSERTSGRFVIASDERIALLRKEQALSDARDFTERVRAIGLGLTETRELIEQIWEEQK